MSEYKITFFAKENDKRAKNVTVNLTTLDKSHSTAFADLHLKHGRFSHYTIQPIKVDPNATAKYIIPQRRLK